MGFSLEVFFQDLKIALNQDKKAAKSLKDIKRIVAQAEQYAKECGQISDT